jgi:tRNA (mo5U34)-methyltransferase
MPELNMTEQEIKHQVQRLAPFHHDVELPFGIRTCLPELSRREAERTRFSTLVRHGFPTVLEMCGGSFHGLRVLDVACNCGGFSMYAAQHGADYVLGIDIVDRYLEQADFLRRASGHRQIEFKKLSVEEIDEERVGQFDVTFFLGILYHLENPILGMKRVASVTRRMVVVDTNLMRSAFMRGPMWRMNFPAVATDQSKDFSTSLWRTERVCQFEPTKEAVMQLLAFVGFPHVTLIKPTEKGLEPRYYRGKRATFVAVRSEGSS